MEGPEKQPDRLNIVGVVVIGLVGALVVYVSFISLQAYYNASASKIAQVREAEGKDYSLRTLRSSQEGMLKGYAWVDRTKQTVRLPIDVAMNLVVADIRKGNPGNLVPAVGPQDTPTVPAAYGRPPDNVQMPAPTPTENEAAPVDGETAPADGEAAAPAGATPAAPADAAPAGATPAAPAGAAPAGATPAAPAAGAATPAAPAAGAAAQPANPSTNTGGNASP